jgi:hypothetical protein
MKQPPVLGNIFIDQNDSGFSSPWMILTITVNLILWLTIGGFSQQNIVQTPLTWKINALTDQASNKTPPYACSFKTNGSRDILWMQKNGQFNTTLAVSDFTGSWANIDSIGVIKYSISAGAERGSISFERTIEGIFVYLVLSQGKEKSLKYKFSVLEVVPTN